MTTADSILPEAACTSTQFHVQTSPDQFAAYWNASQAISVDPARGRRQLAVRPGQGAVARDADPAVRAGRRHPQRGAQGAGRAAAGVVRRALDHLGLRPVRGERPLLPGAAADHRRRGPGGGARGGRHPAALRAAAAQRHDLPLEPAGLRHPGRPPAPAGGEPRAARRPDRRRPDGQRGVLLRAGAHLAESDRPLWSQMSFKAAEENFEAAAEHGIDAEIYWPRVGQVRRPSWSCAGCCRWPAQGLDVWGVPTDGVRPAARHHRAALPDGRQRRRVVRPTR